MSTLRSSHNSAKKSYKIVLLGESGVGKTSIIEQYIYNKFDPQEQPTIGIDFLGKNILHKGQKCRLQLWDSAGQQRYMSLVPAYLKDADCALFVFDLTKQATLERVQRWIDMYRQHCQKRSVAMLCGNKNDLEANFNKGTLKTIMSKHKLPYHSLSAKTGDNLHQLFGLVLDVMSKLPSCYDLDEFETQPTTEGGMMSAKVKIQPSSLKEKKPSEPEKQSGCAC